MPAVPVRRQLPEDQADTDICRRRTAVRRGRGLALLVPDVRRRPASVGACRQGDEAHRRHGVPEAVSREHARAASRTTDRIIHVNLTYSDVLTSIASNKKVEFTYAITFEDRFDRYLENEFFEHRIRWFSIFNSFMMGIFLCGLVALILLRTLKNNYARFAEDDAEEFMMDGKSSLLKNSGNSGWKLLHGEVFRARPICCCSRRWSALARSCWCSWYAPCSSPSARRSTVSRGRYCVRGLHRLRVLDADNSYASVSVFFIKLASTRWLVLS